MMKSEHGRLLARNHTENLEQGWGTCGPREHLIWPASEIRSHVRGQNRVKTKRHDKQVLTQ